MKRKLVSTKEFVVAHKTAFAVTATAFICLAVNSHALKQHNDFLKDHDLYEEFYTPEDTEE